MSSLSEVLLPCLGGNALRKAISFSQTQANAVGWKGTNFRLYAGALIERCFNAVLATHSCKQFTRDVQHTRETSTGKATVISRLASAGWQRNTCGLGQITPSERELLGELVVPSLGFGGAQVSAWPPRCRVLLPDVCSSARFAGTPSPPLSRLDIVFGLGCSAACVLLHAAGVLLPLLGCFHTVMKLSFNSIDRITSGAPAIDTRSQKPFYKDYKAKKEKQKAKQTKKQQHVGVRVCRCFFHLFFFRFMFACFSHFFRFALVSFFFAFFLGAYSKYC